MLLCDLIVAAKYRSHEFFGTSFLPCHIIKHLVPGHTLESLPPYVKGYLEREKNWVRFDAWCTVVKFRRVYFEEAVVLANIETDIIRKTLMLTLLQSALSRKSHKEYTILDWCPPAYKNDQVLIERERSQSTGMQWVSDL